MTEIELSSIIPSSACPLQNLKGIVKSPEQLIKTDLKLIHFAASLNTTNEFCIEDPQTVSGLDVANGSNEYHRDNRLG